MNKIFQDEFEMFNGHLKRKERTFISEFLSVIFWVGTSAVIIVAWAISTIN